MYRARAQTLATLLLCGSGLAASPGRAAEPLPKKVDIAKIHDDLMVLHDRKGRYLVVPNLLDRTVAAKRGSHPLLRKAIYYGDGKAMYRVPSGQLGRAAARFWISMHDPRARQVLHSAFAYRLAHAGGPSFTCDSRKTALWEVHGDARSRLLTKATFRDVFWRRFAYLLARDDDGRYFYTDRRRTWSWHAPKGEAAAVDYKDFHLWIGRRGKTKRVALRDVIIDPAGEIFITKEGKLFHDKRNKKLTWRQKDKSTALTAVPVTVDNGGLVLVYRQLGPYLGRRLHLPCDDW